MGWSPTVTSGKTPPSSTNHLPPVPQRLATRQPRSSTTLETSSTALVHGAIRRLGVPAIRRACHLAAQLLHTHPQQLLCENVDIFSSTVDSDLDTEARYRPPCLSRNAAGPGVGAHRIVIARLRDHRTPLDIGPPLSMWAQDNSLSLCGSPESCLCCEHLARTQNC